MKMSFLNLKYLSEEERLMILDWRNQDRIRKNMVHQEIISKEDHLRYCERLSKQQDCHFYLAFCGDIPFGVVSYTNFNEKESSGEYGLYVANELPGIGLYIGRLAVSYFFKRFDLSKLNIYVLETNPQGILYNEKVLLFKDPDYVPNEFVIDKKEVGAYHYTMTRERWNSSVREFFYKSLNKITFSVDKKNISFE